MKPRVPLRLRFERTFLIPSQLGINARWPNTRKITRKKGQAYTRSGDNIIVSTGHTAESVGSIDQQQA